MRSEGGHLVLRQLPVKQVDILEHVLLLVRLRKHRDALLDNPFEGHLGRRFPVLLPNRRGEGTVHEFKIKGLFR